MASLASGVLSRAAQPTQIGAIRTAIGLTLLARPALLARVLGVDRATAERLDWLAATAAARDLALGAGTIWAARRRVPGESRVATWVVAGAACDVADAVIVSRAIRRRQVNPVLGAAVALSALGGVALGALALRRERLVS